jgi:pseudaminic acid biosynthesis-associated methylase
MNEQEKFWAETYAEAYIPKNIDYDTELAASVWNVMLRKTDGIRSILECGSNIGRNIKTLNIVLPYADKSIIEIGKPAYDIATSTYDLKHSFNGPIVRANFPTKFDLVFTLGVLIHIHPDNLLENMEKMFYLSGKYILMGEYFNRTPTSIKYQGQDNKLFKRDFGKLFIENFDVKLVDYGFHWGHLYDKAGFDDTTWWLFEK